MILGACARGVAIVTMTMVVTGCATTPSEPQPFNAEGHRDIVRIALIESAAPTRILVAPGALDLIGGVPLFMFQASAGAGLGGAAVAAATLVALAPAMLVAAADEAQKSDRFTEALRSSGFDLPAELARELDAQLSRIGFKVSRHKVERLPASPPHDPVWLEQYAPWRDSADAVLDVQVMFAGLRASDPTQPYLPTMLVSARLVGTRSHLVYYRGSAQFGFDPRMANHTDLDRRVGPDATSGVRFQDFDDLMARREVAFDALRSAARVIAARIAFDLAPP